MNVEKWQCLNSCSKQTDQKRYSGLAGGTKFSWPMHMHDPANTSYTASPGPKTNHLLWKFNTGGWIFSSPSVEDGHVFVGSETGKVYCLDQESGEPVWSYRTGGCVFTSSAVAYGFVYVGSRDGYVYCLDQELGELVWKYKTGGSVASSPVVVPSPKMVTGREPFGPRLFVGSFDFHIYCLGAIDGDLRWKTRLGHSVYSSPAVVDPIVYVGCHDLYLHALDAETGKEVWLSPKTGYYGIYSPSFADGKVYFSSSDHIVYSLDAKTGKQIWTFKMGEHAAFGIALAYKKIYLGSGDGYVYCLDQAKGDLVWKYKTEASNSMTPAVAEGKVYVGSTDHFFYCLEAHNGNLIWKYKTGDELRGYGPAVADGKVFVGSKDGYLYCFGKGPTSTKIIHVESKLALGASTTIYGVLVDRSPASPEEPLAGMDVVLYYNLLGGKSKEIAKVKTDINGCFLFNWTPPTEGIYNITIRFAGNESYKPSVATEILQVTAVPS